MTETPKKKTSTKAPARSAALTPLTARTPTAPPQRLEPSAELKDLMRRLKLGRLLDTLPERLALARSQHLAHHDFLEMLLADEVTRRDRQAATLRAERAGLDPTMVLEAWDDTTGVAFDRQLWSELCSLRFLTDAHNTLVMGPVGVGKTHLAAALGHIAVRRRHSVHFERADKLFKRLRAARLDGTYDEELRKLPPRRAAHPRRPRPAPARGDRDQRLLRTRRRTPPPRLHDHDLQPGPGRDGDHDGRPAAGPIRDRPAPVRRVRAGRRRPELPATPETRPRRPRDERGPRRRGLTPTRSRTTINPRPATAEVVPSSWQTGGPFSLARDSEHSANDEVYSPHRSRGERTAYVRATLDDGAALLSAIVRRVAGGRWPARRTLVLDRAALVQPIGAVLDPWAKAT